MATVCNLSEMSVRSLAHSGARHSEPFSSELDMDLNALMPQEYIPTDDILPSASGFGGSDLDAKAREKLFKRFNPWLQKLMRRYRMTHEAREDALGDLYCHFCNLLEKFDPGRGVPLEPYLYRQLGAFLYTHARSNWRRSRRELPLYSDSGHETVGHLAGDPTRDWDDRLASHYVQSLLPMAFEDMPTRQYLVITMRYCRDQSYEEIASQLGIKLATARSLARNGLNSLREWMQERRAV